jgi:protein ImuB
LVRRIEQALGEVDEPLGVYHAPAEHVQSLTLEYPTSDQQILADRIERLIGNIVVGLAAGQRGALRMVCDLNFSGHPPRTLEIGLFAPSTDAGHLAGLMIHQLDARPLPACVERLTLSVTLSGPLRSVQTSLFDDPSRDANSAARCMSGSAISRLIDSLSGRLGRDSVVGVKMEDDPLPEKAFSVSALAGNTVAAGESLKPSGNRSGGAAQSSPRSSSGARVAVRQGWHPTPMALQGGTIESISCRPSPDDAMRRPLALIAPPVPLAVALNNGPFHWSVSSPELPSRLRLHGISHQIAAHWGPERIETGWWNGSSIRRDYFRVETDQGRWWWIFRNLVSKTKAGDRKHRYRWMLHGRFT